MYSGELRPVSSSICISAARAAMSNVSPDDEAAMEEVMEKLHRTVVVEGHDVTAFVRSVVRFRTNVSTRFVSLYPALASLKKHKNAVAAALPYFHKIDFNASLWSRLDWLLEILKPMSETITYLSGSNQVTLPHVFPRLLAMKKTYAELIPRLEESRDFRLVNLAERLNERLEEVRASIRVFHCLH